MVSTFKTLNTGSIATGSYKEVEWTPDRDITILKLLIVERSDVSLSNAQVFISIADVPYTKDYVPGSAIGQDVEYCWKPNLPVPKGAKIYLKISNNTGSAINCDVVFEYA